jgi:hypothetical protein
MNLRPHISIVSVCFVVIAGLLPAAASGEIFLVEAGSASAIQALIDDVVADGDVIQLESGDFLVESPITPRGLAIEIRGRVDARGVPVSRLVGGGGTGILVCRDGEGGSTRFEDLVLTGGDIDLGGGLLINGAGPTLRRVRFIDNRASIFGGGVAIFGASSSPLFEDCRFDGNQADLVGGGCLNGTDATPVYRRCEWNGNGVGLYGRAMYNQSGSFPSLEDCTVTGCCQIVPPGSFTDLGRNLVEPVCDECPADFNCYGGVGAADLGLLLGAWGTKDPTYDLDQDGVVGGGDIGALVSRWGPCDVFIP